MATIAGPAAVSWSLAPTVTVEEVALTNAPGAASPTLVKVGRLEFRLRLRALLGGNLEIDRLSLRDVVLDLERDAGGIGNWHLRSTAPVQGKVAGEWLDPLPQPGLGGDHHHSHRAPSSRPERCPAGWRRPISASSGSSWAIRRSPAAPS